MTTRRFTHTFGGGVHGLAISALLLLGLALLAVPCQAAFSEPTCEREIGAHVQTAPAAATVGRAGPDPALPRVARVVSCRFERTEAREEDRVLPLRI